MPKVIDENININVLKQLASLAEKKHLAHAYLFVGPEGIGKKETALAAAKLINCEDKKSIKQGLPCEECSSCVKISSGNHPDIMILDKGEEGNLKISDIRNILDMIKLRPFFAGHKVFIINDIENLTDEAANALLKTLEEPSDNSVLLLTTSMLEKNFDTIVSRCHIVKFVPSSSKDIDSMLKKIYGMDGKASRFITYFSEGCPGKARSAAEEGFFDVKNSYIDGFVLSGNTDTFIKDIAKNKDSLRDFSKVLLFWVRDMMLAKLEITDENFVNIDRLKDIKALSSKYSFDDINALYKDVVKLSEMIEENLNVKVPLQIIKERL